MVDMEQYANAMALIGVEGDSRMKPRKPGTPHKGWKAAARKRHERAPRRRWVEVPVPPTPDMLAGMRAATWLKDGSDLEMERRFNGMLERLPKRRQR